MFFFLQKLPKLFFLHQFREHQFLSKFVLTVLKAGLIVSYGAYVFHISTFIFEPILTHRPPKYRSAAAPLVM